MPPTPRWTAVCDFAFTWEAEAIAWLRERLPDSAAYRGWSNFEFVAQDGSVNAVDALIVTPTKLLLVEIKSRPGAVKADSGAWAWTRPDGRMQVDENPLPLASRKTKRLSGLLRNTKALKGKASPYVEEVVFLSYRDLRADFSGSAATRVFLRAAASDSDRNIGACIAGSAENSYGGRMDHQHLRAAIRALEELNIRPVRREFGAGQWRSRSAHLCITATARVTHPTRGRSVGGTHTTLTDPECELPQYRHADRCPSSPAVIAHPILALCRPAIGTI